MKRITITVVMLVAMILSMTLQGMTPEEKKPDNFLPRIGSIYVLETEIYIVRGAGNTLFEYTATGVNLEVKVMNMPGTITITTKKGEKVIVDPTVPMVSVAGKENQEFLTNNFLKKEAKRSIFLLLEIKK